MSVFGLVLTTGPGAGCCAAAPAPALLAGTDASGPLVSGSGPAASGPGPR